jgi:hypothetical protein
MSQRLSWITGVAGAVTGVFIAAGIAYATVPTFSQTNIAVGLGQSLTVTTQNGVSVYMVSNSSPTIATVSINGTQVAVTGQALGAATLDICAVGTSGDCTNLYVTVQAASVSGIAFSQNNLSLSIGSNQSVTVSGGNGTYTVSNNSNTSVASTNLSGSTLTVSGLAAGGATINICDTTNTCNTLSVTINSASTSGLTFNQNNLALVSGGNQVVTVSGGTGTYHISNNSNATALSAGTTGTNGVTVYALAAGSATLTICDTSNLCGTLVVNVTAPAVTQAVVFSVANPTLAVGQTTNVQLSGSNAPGYVILSNANTSVATANITGGTTLSLYGASAGTDSLTICATGGGCDPLPVTVTGPVSTAAATTTATTAPATTTVTQTTAPTTTVTQPTTVVANTALLSEIQTLQTAVTQALTQIQSIQTEINQLEAQVSVGSGSDISTNVSASSATNASSGTAYNFTELLTAGSSDAEVTALQQRLTALGFYSGPITGFYGTLTGAAVSKYQTAHGITATGYVGPSTRTALNAGN